MMDGRRCFRIRDHHHVCLLQGQPLTMMEKMPLQPAVAVVMVTQITQVIDFHNPFSRGAVLICFHILRHLCKFMYFCDLVRYSFMKNIFITAVLAICCQISSLAQIASAPSAVPFSAEGSATPLKLNIDTDLYTLRNDLFPELSYEWDDILQYSPAAVMLGMKACGYESRTKWAGMLVSDAFSVGIMAATVNGIKYSVRRLRPDGSRYNSFPSGHTATAFMTATMLHKEYGWRSPWFSIGSYTVATVTGVSRILNNRHWMSDVVAGAAIGIGSVHLGYFITDKIFKDKHLYDGYEKPALTYDGRQKHYVAELLFGRRLIIGGEGRKNMGELPQRGSLVGLQTDIPVIAGVGVTARGSASSLIYIDSSTSDMLSATAGGYWNFHFAKILELQTRVGLGYAWLCKSSDDFETSFAPTDHIGGIDLTAGVGLSLITDNNFKIKAFADFESVSFNPHKPWLNTFVLGYSAAWFW